MNIIHFALVHILSQYYDSKNDCYKETLLQTIYEREGNFGFVDLLNHIEQGLYTDSDSDDEEEIYNMSKQAFENHMKRYKETRL